MNEDKVMLWKDVIGSLVKWFSHYLLKFWHFHNLLSSQSTRPLANLMHFSVLTFWTHPHHSLPRASYAYIQLLTWHLHFHVSQLSKMLYPQHWIKILSWKHLFLFFVPFSVLWIFPLVCCKLFFVCKSISGC